jgi:hypothetical protein
VEDEEEYLDQDKEEYSDQDKEEYSDQDEETTVRVGNLPYGIDSQYLGQLFWYAGVVVFSEVSLPSPYCPSPFIDRSRSA